MPPLVSRNRAATIRCRSAPRRLQEIRVPAIAGIRANCCTRPGHASNACRLVAPVDVGIPVSSVAPLTVRWRVDVPVLFQSLANFSLG